MADLGLSIGQLANAKKIVAAGQARGESPASITIAIGTAITESGLQNYANSNVPESMAIPHDAVGNDHASVGVFQQQVGIWGTAAELMDVTISANKFFDALDKTLKKSPYLSPGAAAQAVQGSAFPDRYATHMNQAQLITNSLDTSLTPKASEPQNNSPLGLLMQVNSIFVWFANAKNLVRIAIFFIGVFLLSLALFRMLQTTHTGSAVINTAKNVAKDQAKSMVK